MVVRIEIGPSPGQDRQSAVCLRGFDGSNSSKKRQVFRKNFNATNLGNDFGENKKKNWYVCINKQFFCLT